MYQKNILMSIFYLVNIVASSTIRGSNYLFDEQEEPKLLVTDLAYHKFHAPIVLEKYKLLFFSNPKVASTDLKLLIRRMSDKPDVPRGYIHQQEFTNLYDYPIEVASEMMTSDEWTRAIFIRDPKERTLSAYLNKAVKDDTFFKEHCCRYMSIEQCERYWWSFEEFLDLTEKCHERHWDPQYSIIDEKYWPYMNFFGDFSDLANETERFLRQLGGDAWEKYGATGWGKDGTSAIFVRNNAGHKTGSHDKMKIYYTPDLEEVIENRYIKDYDLIDRYVKH